jgi:Tol biopolymer transport system component
MKRTLLGLLTATIILPLNAQEAFHPLRGPYMGQEAKETPQQFLPGKITTGRNEGCSLFFKDGRSFLWRVSRDEEDQLLLLEGTNGRWQPPREVSFLEGDSVWDFTISPDGREVLFTTNRPLDNARENNLWSIPISNDGWGKPLLLGPKINSDWNESYPSLSRNGKLYFVRQNPDDLDASDLYCAPASKEGFERAFTLTRTDQYCKP